MNLNNWTYIILYCLISIISSLTRIINNCKQLSCYMIILLWIKAINEKKKTISTRNAHYTILIKYVRLGMIFLSYSTRTSNSTTDLNDVYSSSCCIMTRKRRRGQSKSPYVVDALPARGHACQISPGLWRWRRQRWFSDFFPCFFFSV